jgi:hypothetical protein
MEVGMSASKDVAIDIDWIDEAAVATLARAAGFVLRPEELPAIAGQLRRAFEIAAPLLAYEPADDEEPGPIWRP